MSILSSLTGFSGFIIVDTSFCTSYNFKVCSLRAQRPFIFFQKFLIMLKHGSIPAYLSPRLCMQVPPCVCSQGLVELFMEIFSRKSNAKLITSSFAPEISTYQRPYRPSKWFIKKLSQNHYKKRGD